jgi:hypothetical protein
MVVFAGDWDCGDWSVYSGENNLGETGKHILYLHADVQFQCYKHSPRPSSRSPQSRASQPTSRLASSEGGGDSEDETTRVNGKPIFWPDEICSTVRQPALRVRGRSINVST